MKQKHFNDLVILSEYLEVDVSTESDFQIATVCTALKLHPLLYYRHDTNNQAVGVSP